MKKTLMIICFLFLYIGNSQTLDYDIISKGYSIGHLTTTKTVKDSIVQIDVVSEVSVRILVKIDVKYKLQSTYKNNELFFSSITTYVNGKVHSTCKTEKTGNHYTITKDGQTTKFFNKIDFSNALLYYEMPKSIVTVFSESSGLEKKVKQTGAYTYDVINPKNDHISQYSYATNGVLEKATVHNTLMTFILTKK